MLNLYLYHTNPPLLDSYEETSRVAKHVFNLVKSQLQKHFNREFYGEYPVMDAGDFYVTINPLTTNWYVSDEHGSPDSEMMDISYDVLVSSLEDLMY